MKKFVAKVLAWLAFCVAITIVFPYVVDPYNVFHVENAKIKGVEPNKNYIKMTWVLENPDKFDSFLFGSSRVGAIHTENIEGLNCYNMTYSAGLPSEYLANMKTIINNGIDVKRFYVGLDSLAYTDSSRNHDADPMRMSYEYIQENKSVFYKTYFDPLMTTRSLPIIIKNSEGEWGEVFYNYGWWCGYDYPVFEWWTYPVTPYIGDSQNLEQNMDEVCENISQMKKLCDDNGIELIVFTNPMHYITQQASDEVEYDMFLEKLSQVTGYYNFSGYNDITLDETKYIDSSHFNAYVGDMMTAAMDGNVEDKLLEQGFGMYVDQTNVSELISIINNSKSRIPEGN